MTASGQILTSRQQKAIIALLQQPTIEKAAVSAHIGVATIYRWLRQDAFRKAYRVARNEAVSRAMARLQRASSGAVDILVELMACDATPASVRMGAARCVLEMAVKTLESEDLAARIEALEKRIAVGGGPWRR